MKGIIIYKSKYGATRQYAQWLGSALRLPVMTSEDIDGTILTNSEFIVLGGSVYIGKLLISDWIKKNAMYIKNKKLFLFIVSGTTADEKEKQEEIIRENIREEIRDHCDIYFLRGRKIMKDLSWMDRLLLRMGAALTRNPDDKKRMLQDFDEVKTENLNPLITSIMALAAKGEKNTINKAVRI
ncbi:MAG TPA: flavodoxin domain-containing protein [Puia sp.]|nr:flavodoxin domain-containing protein [Puia sp.]